MITENEPVRTLELYEVIALFEKQKSKPKRIKVLQEHKSSSLKDYLQCLFDDRVQFLLPAGKPPYTPAPEESIPSSWRKRNVDLQYIVKGLAGERLLPIKRESIFIGILETIHPMDAELIVKMINKTPPITSLTKEIVAEAFPEIFPKK